MHTIPLLLALLMPANAAADTSTFTSTATSTSSATSTASATATASTTETATPTRTGTVTASATVTSTQTSTATYSGTKTATPTRSGTVTRTHSSTRTITSTKTFTATASRTSTETLTLTATRTATTTLTRTVTPTVGTPVVFPTDPPIPNRSVQEAANLIAQHQLTSVAAGPTADPLLTATPANFNLTCHQDSGLFAADCEMQTVSGTGPVGNVIFVNAGSVPVSFLRYGATIGGAFFTCPNANFPAGEVVTPFTTRFMPPEWFTDTSFMISWPAGTSATDTVHWCYFKFFQ